MVTVKVAKGYRAKRPNWCPGCGDFAIKLALERAVDELGIPRHNLVVVGGIGCSGKIPDFIEAYGFHTVHGRTIPTATAIKLANPKLTVVAAAGDGDGYGIGAEHIPHAARRNIGILFLVFNNNIYGLTKGQASPTTPVGFKTGSSPYGVKEKPVDPILTSLGVGTTFVARGFSGNINHLKELIKQALRHRGFAHIDVLTPCVTWLNTWDYYRKRIFNLDEEAEKGAYDPYDRAMAFKKVIELQKEGRVPIGIIFRDENTPSFEELVLQDLEKPVFDAEKMDLAKNMSEYLRIIKSYI